jgi:hypothetical protein
VNGARLAYELSGTGELLMLIHVSNLATGRMRTHRTLGTLTRR